MKIGCGGGVSINDLGCGYGALYEFIKMNNMRLSKYFGYDISEVMIEAANEFILKNNQEKDCEIFLENSSLITHYADYSIASGIFNTIFDEQESQWRDYILAVLHNMNEKSYKGFSFNMLTDKVDFRGENLYYANPCYYFEICRKYFSKKVVLLHDYPLFEWTILVLK